MQGDFIGWACSREEAGRLAGTAHGWRAGSLDRVGGRARAHCCPAHRVIAEIVACLGPEEGRVQGLVPRPSSRAPSSAEALWQPRFPPVLLVHARHTSFCLCLLPGCGRPLAPCHPCWACLHLSATCPTNLYCPASMLWVVTGAGTPTAGPVAVLMVPLSRWGMGQGHRPGGLCTERSNWRGCSGRAPWWGQSGTAPEFCWTRQGMNGGLKATTSSRHLSLACALLRPPLGGTWRDTFSPSLLCLSDLGSQSSHRSPDDQL